MRAKGALSRRLPPRNVLFAAEAEASLGVKSVSSSFMYIHFLPLEEREREKYIEGRDARACGLR
jgi:hypothetical protein